MDKNNNKVNWLSMGPSFKICWGNCLIFLFFISLLFGPFFRYIFVYSFIYCNLILIMGIFLAQAL